MRQRLAPIRLLTGAMNESRRSALLGAYRAASWFGQPLAAPMLAWRTRNGKEDPARCSERYGIASRPRVAGPLVWVHAASVGETVSVLPLVGRLTERYPLAGLLTTGTMTSARIAGERLPDQIVHQYAPLDARRFVRRFLAHWQPDIALFTESELWPNMILETAARGTKLALVNARMSERSFRRWQSAPAMIRALLARIDLCLAQSAADAERLIALGASPVLMTGNLKFDAPAPRAPEHDLVEFREAIGDRPCWAAASLHSGEDNAAIEAHLAAARHFPRLLTILAPRHPERGVALAAVAAASGLRVSRRSIEPKPDPDTDIFVMDTIGELGLVYRVAQIAFIGGSLIPHGGQNPIEPAKLSAAILHGPFVNNFVEIYAALDGGGGAEEIRDGDALAERLCHLLDDAHARAARTNAAFTIIETFGGALERTIAAMDPLLAPFTEH